MLNIACMHAYECLLVCEKAHLCLCACEQSQMSSLRRFYLICLFACFRDWFLLARNSPAGQRALWICLSPLPPSSSGKALFHLSNQPLLLFDTLDDVIKWWDPLFISVCLRPPPSFHQLHALRTQRGQTLSLILGTLKSLVGRGKYRLERDLNSVTAVHWKSRGRYKAGTELGLCDSYCRT